MKQSTSFAQVATNLLNVLQGYTKGIRFVAVLTMLLSLGIGQAWGAEGDIIKSFACSVSSATTYARYTPTCDDIEWNISLGQTRYIGTNKSSNFGNLKITNNTDLNAAKGVNSSVNTSSQGYVTIIPQSAMNMVGKITISCTALSGSPKVYVVSSSSLSTPYSQIELNTGNGLSAQGATMSTSGLTFEFDTQNQETYYAVVLYSTAWYRLTDTSIEFIEGATTPTCINPTISWATEPANGVVGGTMKASVTTNYSAGLTYTSSYTNVATVDNSGNITYKATGSTTITAKVIGDGNTYCDKTVTVTKTINVTCGSKVTINTTSDGNGTITINKTPIETCSDNDGDRQITITLNPNSHYSSNAPTISGITNATITGSGNTYTVQLPKGSNGTLSVSATFKEDAKYTVTWSADGTPIKTQEVYVNEQVSEVLTSSDIPEENRCGDKFVGWTDAENGNYTHGTSKLYQTIGEIPAITGNITFYAVFADYAD